MRLPAPALWVLPVALALAGCSDRLDPRHLGLEADDLKRSPCACLEVPQLPPERLPAGVAA